MLQRTPAHLPHHLRLTIFFLRVSLGWLFLSYGLNELLSPSWDPRVALSRGTLLPELYAWLASPEHAGLAATIYEWGYLLVGVALIFGFMTRVASIAGVAISGVAYLGSVDLASQYLLGLVNTQVIFILCLLVLFFSRAGTYLGIDRFWHFSLKHKHAR